MAILEKITANLELTELKKFKLQKAILTLMLEWKHLEEYMDSTQHLFHECIDELQHKEEHLNSVKESVIESNRELDSVRASIEERMKQLEDKEREFAAFRDEHDRELDLREERMVLIRKSIEERIEEVGLKEEKLKGIVEEFKVEEKRFEDVRERIDVIKCRELRLEKRIKEFNVFRDEGVKELDLKEKRLVLITESVEERIKQVELREAKVKAMFEEFNVEEISSKQIELDERSRELDGVRDWIERRVKELDDEEEDIERRLKKLESKDKELGDRVKEIKLMEKQISNVGPTKDDTELDLEDNPVNSSTGIGIWDKMDGKRLQLFLNQREKDHNTMAEEVYRAFQLSPDPAKLVLDAMEGFYPTDPNKGEGEFKLDVIRRSCTLLLEQLLRISPQVRPQVKVEAMKLVCQWKAKLSAVPDPMEVLGHLYLLASFCLPVPFGRDELLGFVEIVAEHRQAPELCRLLGLTDRISDLIRNLRKKNHSLVAVRFVSEFGLVDEFPPALLLNDYMKHVRQSSKQMLRKNKSCKVHQNDVREKRIAALREAIRCIKDHKLESEYSPKGIEQTIDQLLMQKEDNKGTSPSPPNEPVELGKSRKVSMSSIDSPILSNPPSMVPISSKPVPTKLGPVTDMAFILANMDGRSLQLFLNEHFVDHDLMHNEVLLALQHSVDPARLVLEAMQGFHFPHVKDGEHFKVGVIRSSCILLLEQFLRLQRHIHPQVKGEAMVIARQWKLKMRDEVENTQVILGFLQFIGAFGLTSHVAKDELHCLTEKIASYSHARELCEVLRFSEKKPRRVPHSRAIRPAQDSYFVGVNMKGKSEVAIFHYVSDPAKLVLDAIRGCYQSNLEKGANFSKSKIMDKFASLLEQLMDVSPKIKSRVQEEAMKFSVVWKSKLSVSRENEAEVKTFLHLLATYKLSSSVMFEVLHALLETVREYKQKFEFYRLLNFTPKTPDYVQYLIEKDERLLAIRFIYEFDLVEKFPPVPILNSHLRYIQKLCTKICEDGDYSPEAKDKAADTEVALLGAVIRCLQIHKIDCDCTPESLQEHVDRIKKQKGDKKALLPTGGSMAQKEELDMKKCAINFDGQTQQQDAIKRPRLTAPVTAPQNVAPLAMPEAYPVNPIQAAPPNPQGFPIGQGRPYLAWQYGHGGMAPIGWQYRPDAGAYHGVPNNVIPRPSIPQGPTPYLYRPWQQP